MSAVVGNCFAAVADYYVALVAAVADNCVVSLIAAVVPLVLQ